MARAPVGKLGRAMTLPFEMAPMSYRKLVRWSYAVVRLSPWPFIAATVVMLGGTLLTQYSTKLLSDIVSAVTNGALDPGLRHRAYLYVAVVVLVIALQFGGKLLSGWSDTLMVARLQQSLHDKLLALDAGFHDKHDLGQTTSLVLQSSGGAQQMLSILASFPILRGAPFVTAVLFLAQALANLQSSSLGYAVIVLVVVLAVLGSRLSGRLQAAAGASQLAQAALTTEFVNSASQPLEVQILGAQSQRAASFAARLRSMVAAKIATTLRLTAANQFQATMSTVVQTVFLVYAVLVLTDTGSGAAGSIIAIYYFVPQVIGPVQEVLGFNIGLHASWPMVSPVGELLDAQPAAAAGQSDVPEGSAVSLQDVTLRYAPGGRAVLDGLSHSFEPGQITAIVGRSGSGKSTILSMINGIRAPSSGSVMLGGVPVGHIRLDSLRRRVVTVSQFPLFVADTVRANFLLGKADATDAEIEAACRKTGIWPVLSAAAPGSPLDAQMSRVAGQGLSGGERRLFAIARALLCQPSVLLLDEPTTGIDRMTVQTLAESLPELLAELTVIIVEHDMSFVERIAGEVCCLEDGRFAEVGSPAALAGGSSLFARLRAAQRSLADTDGLTIQSVKLPDLYDPSATSKEG